MSVRAKTLENSGGIRPWTCSCRVSQAHYFGDREWPAEEYCINTPVLWSMTEVTQTLILDPNGTKKSTSLPTESQPPPAAGVYGPLVLSHIGYARVSSPRAQPGRA